MMNDCSFSQLKTKGTFLLSFHSPFFERKFLPYPSPLSLSTVSNEMKLPTKRSSLSLSILLIQVVVIINPIINNRRWYGTSYIRKVLPRSQHLVRSLWSKTCLVFKNKNEESWGRRRRVMEEGRDEKVTHWEKSSLRSSQSLMLIVFSFLLHNLLFEIVANFPRLISPSNQSV